MDFWRKFMKMPFWLSFINTLTLDSQVPIQVLYESHIVGNYLADIIVEESIVLELKAQKTLLTENSAQLINYLKAGKIQNGLLVNFGAPKIEIKRLYGNR
jgi:GxxExxY protein